MSGDSRWRGGDHPPACTCHDCVQRRLRRLRPPPIIIPTPLPPLEPQTSSEDGDDE